nr:hypothetical protein [Bacteroidota bacterium]
MKKLFTLLSIGFLALQLCAQVPQGIQFQLIIRDGNGNILPEQELVLQLSVIQEIPEGNIVYQETHDVVTNAFGLVNIVIGQGNSSIGNFSELDWGIGPYFLQTAIDLEGIGAFQIMGAAQFLSVPYALYAGQVNDTSTWSKQEDAVYYDKGQVAVGTNQPDSSAALDVTSDVQGFLPPRMTTEERDAIPNPAAGLIIYNTNIHCINFYNGVEWIEWGRDPMDTFECGQVFTDTRDKKQYRTVQIGEQCWFAENLNYGTKVNATTSQTDNGQVEKYCYENSPANCLEYGGLYQWDEMMAYDTVEFTQGICPEGWHLPNQAEWQMLIDAYGGASLAGNELVSAGTSGFDALMNGKYESGTGFSGKDNLSTFWSSTGIPGTTGTGLDIESGNPAVNTTNTSVLNAFGVRCVQGLPNRIDPSVRVIDTTVYHLISDSLELSQGIYRYEIIGSRKSKDIIVADNIVIGIEDDGYLRKVEEAVINGNEMTLTTISATMEDTFIEGEFDFSTDLTGKGGSGFSFTRITYVAPGVEISPGEDGGIQFNFNNYILYEAPNISAKITAGHVSLNPNFKFDFKFKYSQVKRLAFYADQTSFNDSLDVQLTVTGSVNESIEKTIATNKKYMLKMVGYVPVVVVITTELKWKAVLNFNAAFSATTGYTNTNTLSFGMKYEYGNWQKIWKLQSNTKMDPLAWNGNITFIQELQIIPEIDIKFYGVAGPYFNLPLWEKLKANFVVPAMNFDASLDVGLNGNIGANVTIFGKPLASYNK